MVKLILLFLFVHHVEMRILKEDKPIQVHSSEERVEISNLQGTLYSKSLSELSVTELQLSIEPLKKVEPGAICSSPKLKKFRLLFWKPEQGKTEISKESFNHCDNLQELLLSTDDDFELNTDTFDKLTNLKKLDLYGIKLNPVKRDYFKNLKSLNLLSLRWASISEIEADAFSDLQNLEELYIMFNTGLTHLPKALLKSTPKLKKLTLWHNNLTGLSWNEFEGLSSLEELMLGGNRISSADAEIIATNLPNLKWFGLELNSWDCKKREDFSKELRSKLNHKIEIRLGNGFYDPCEVNKIL